MLQPLRSFCPRYGELRDDSLIPSHRPRKCRFVAGRRTGLPPFLGWKWEVVNPFCLLASLLSSRRGNRPTRRRLPHKKPASSSLFAASGPYVSRRGLSPTMRMRGPSPSFLSAPLNPPSLLKPFLRRDRRAKLDSKCFREAAATGINGLALKADLSSLPSPRRRRMAWRLPKKSIRIGNELLWTDDRVREGGFGR